MGENELRNFSELERERLRLELKLREREIIKRSAIDRYYPDAGPLRRELYQKHIEFMSAGSEYRQRLMLAANRVGKCCTINTLIDTPQGKVRIAELLGKGEFDVISWDGEKKVVGKAHSPFKKNGLHKCYRLTMADGQFVEVADHHRILCVDGWRLLSELLPESFQSRPVSSSVFSRSIHASGVRRLFGSVASYLDGCFSCRRLCDEPLHEARGTSQFSVLSQAYAQGHTSAWCGKDDLESICTNNHQQAYAHHSSKNAFQRFSARFVEFLNHIAYTTVQLLRGLILKFQRPSAALFRQLRSFGVVDQYKDNELLLALSGILVVDGNKIISCDYISYNDVYDFTVEKYHNYVAGSMVHHNTEGVGGYETACHLTGIYPAWWTGRRFEKPVRAWAAGDTAKTVRDIIQHKLLGAPGDYGTGLIRGDCIIKTTVKTGISDAVDTITVKHSSGGQSSISLKSYDQRREAFQGTEQDLIWLDEEPPLAIYTECLLRTMTNNGIVMCTFTPLMGMSDVVLSFLPGGKIDIAGSDPSKFVVMATWDDVPHLSDAVKKELYDSIPPFQRDARSKGIPQLGAGAIYPVPETDLLVTDFEIPTHWPRCYALDVGWNRTAAIWGALDRDTDTLYLYSEHYRGQAEPILHAEAIKGRGAWIPGVIDPASRGRSQHDGIQLLQQYVEMGLDLQPAKNAVEAGLYAVWQRMSAGKLKVFKSCTHWTTEFRLYRRDESGRIVKDSDHLMDTMRYLVMSGIDIAITKPSDDDNEYYSSGGWMG